MATIKEIKEKLCQISDPNDDFLKELAFDSRKGVKQLLKSWKRNYQKQQQLKEHFEKMCIYEKKLRMQGYQFIAGIDEVGRGPLAGPVVAAAVILPCDFALLEVNDSKQLSETKREELYFQIKEQALAIGIGSCDNKRIDEINIYEATKEAMLKAIDELKVCDYLLLDAMELDINIPQTKIIHGDALSISIAAASIIAKVTRDNMMKEYDEIYPGYDFKNNAGYGTAKHLEGLEKLGITPIHRKSFAPIKNLI